MKTAFFCLPIVLLANASLAADCQSLDRQFQQQVQASQMDAAESTLQQITNACPQRIVQADELYFTDTLASLAEALATDGKLDQANALLKKAKRNSWMLSSVRGYLASQRKPTDWGEVAEHYNYALELFTDPKDASLSKLPNLAETRQRILALATDAQLLYGKPAPAARDGQPHGILLAAARGIGGSQIPYPVHFDTNSASLNPDGKSSADVLVAFLLNQHPATITLVGHADPRGGESDNQTLSEQRAQALADYLKQHGVTGDIKTIGKGETEAPVTSGLTLTEQEHWRRWRRVELSLGR